MKDSISLRELFEEKACIDSIKYFIKCIEVFEIYNKNSDNNLYNQQYTIDSVIKVLKHHDQYFFDDINVNEYFNWLKNNGYKIEDNEDIKNQINELKSKITSLENKLL